MRAPRPVLDDLRISERVSLDPRWRAVWCALCTVTVTVIAAAHHEWDQVDKETRDRAEALMHAHMREQHPKEDEE